MLSPEVKILIIGSDTIPSAHPEIILGKFGLTPMLAKDSISAIRYCDDNTFDLILLTAIGRSENTLDIATQVCQPHLKTNQPLKTPLIMFDAGKAPQKKETLLLAGIDEHITEPISESALIKLLANWMGYGLSDHNTTFKALLARPVEIEECLNRSQQSTELAKDVLKVLIGGLEEQKKEIKMLHQNNDRKGLQILAHKIRGSCCCSGVPLLNNQTLRLEKLLQQNNRVNIDLIVSNLIRAITQLQSWSGQHDIDALFE